MSESKSNSSESPRVAKYVATGNDFLFIDARARLPGAFVIASRSRLASRLCDRHFGIGADGIVFVENSDRSRDAKSNTPRLKWDFYNSDGSTAEMCGNASRCMGRWAERVLRANAVEFETVSGVVRCEIQGAEVASHLSEVRVDFKALKFRADGVERSATLVNTGVPHAVYEIDDVKRASTANDIIGALRFHPSCGEKGANVTFMQRLSEDRFSTVTFERGVEGFTLSCGTGVLAAAAVGLRERGGGAAVQTPGGELSVRFGDGLKGATLRGPARFVFETSISEEFAK